MFATKSLSPPSNGRVIARLVLTTAAFIVFCVCQSARGDIIFGLGNSPANKNVGNFELQSSTSANGEIVGPGTIDVLLAEADVDITIPPNELSLEAAGDLFTTVTFSPIGSDWEVFEANLSRGNTDGTFVIKALDDDGNEYVSATFDLGNGNNRFFAQAINGQTITQVTVEASGALIDEVGQIRISQSLVAIPEPGSFALCGAAVFGLILLRRRKRSIA